MMSTSYTHFHGTDAVNAAAVAVCWKTLGQPSVRANRQALAARCVS